jgi:hypothetical protein
VAALHLNGVVEQASLPSKTTIRHAIHPALPRSTLSTTCGERFTYPHYIEETALCQEALCVGTPLE